MTAMQAMNTNTSNELAPLTQTPMRELIPTWAEVEEDARAWNERQAAKAIAKADEVARLEALGARLDSFDTREEWLAS